jgi:hypothetical protein
VAEQNNYYTAEAMQDKKLSDLTLDRDFLTDAVAFLKSDRLQYTDDDLKEMSASDVTDKVLEHMRYQTVNERTMYKDYSFIADENTPDNERQAFSRLMFAFDNAKGEGMFDRGGEKLQDYAGAVLSSPTTMLAGAAGLFTAGTGAVAVKAGAELLKAGGKAVSSQMLRKAAIESMKKASITAAADGSIAAATDLANQRIRQIGGKTIGEERDVSLGQAAVSGVIGAAPGLAMYGAGRLVSNRASKKLLEAGQMGEEAMMARRAAGKKAAVKTSAKAKKTEDGEALLGYVSNTLLRAIDPRMVEKGKIVREDIFSSDLPDGLIGGFDVDTIQRIAAAGYEVAEQMGVTGAQVRDGKRITEVIADSIRDGDGKAMAVIDTVREKYNLSREQLSSAYAAEVSDAARILRSSRTARDKAYADKIDSLYEQGMSPVTKDEMKVMKDVKQGMGSVVINNLKDLENARRMFMTSQPATTMRNNIFSVAMTGIDMVDQLTTATVRAIRPGAEKSSTATAKGALDNLRYLSSDSYTAEALTNMLQENAPKRMQKVFYDAAIAEEAVTGSNKFSKVGAFLNVMNTMSDRVVKRAVIAGTIDRRLKELGNEELGTSVMDMMRKGRTQDLPDDILQEALDESLAFTFQRRFGGKDASTESKAVGSLIRTIHNYGLTLAIPFPRYLASQAKFVSDYTGLTVLRRGVTGRRVSDAEIGKAATGGLGVMGLLKVYQDKVYTDTAWNEVEDPKNNRVYDAQSAMGPLTAHAYTMDYVARRLEGMPHKGVGEFSKELGKILGVSEFRPDTGFIDSMVAGLEGNGWEKFNRSALDTITPFTYPAAVFKDFYGQFDPRSAYLPSTEDATSSTAFSFLDVDIPMNVYQRITRQLPDFNTEQMATTFNEMFGTNLKSDGVLSYLEFASSATRAQFQNKYAEDALGNPLSYDAIRMNVLGDSPLRILDPLDKQLTGLVGRPPKNTLEREIVRLQINPFKDIYNPYREKNRLLEAGFQQFAQGRMARDMEQFMEGAEYQNYTDEQKRVMLPKQFRAFETLYREAVEDQLKRYASATTEELGDYQLYIKGQYKAMSDSDRKLANSMWKDNRGYYSKSKDSVFETQDMSIDDAIDYVKNSEDFTDEEKKIYETNLYRLIVDEVSLLRRRINKKTKAEAKVLAAD